jgi:hypothetical protein
MHVLLAKVAGIVSSRVSMTDLLGSKSKDKEKMMHLKDTSM